MALIKEKDYWILNMLKNFVILFLGLLLLSGCTDGFRSYFKKSANNKLIDSKGFEGGKRKPLNNNKYITLAKKNIVEDNLDDDEEQDLDDANNPLKGETIDPVKRNRDMYLKMIKKDMNHQKNKKQQNDEGMALNEGSKKIKASNRDNDKEEKLEQEIAKIKEMLNDTRRDLTKYSCPNAAAPKNYVSPTNNYEPRPNTPVNDNINLYNKKSKVKQKFIREDDDITNGSGCAI